RMSWRQRVSVLSKEAAMAEELNLGEAARALEAEYGETFRAGLDDGKEMLAVTLQDRLKLDREAANRVVDALIEAHTIRWEGKPGKIGVQESGMFNVSTQRLQEGTWYI